MFQKSQICSSVMIILLNITCKYHKAVSATKLVLCNNQTEKSHSIFEETKSDANFWVSTQKCHPCPCDNSNCVFVTLNDNFRSTEELGPLQRSLPCFYISQELINQTLALERDSHILSSTMLWYHYPLHR